MYILDNFGQFLGIRFRAIFEKPTACRVPRYIGHGVFRCVAGQTAGADLGGPARFRPPPFGGEFTIFHYARTHQNVSNGNNNVKKIPLRRVFIIVFFIYQGVR